MRAFDLLGIPHDRIKAVTMPGFGTTDRTYDNAVSLIRCLGADSVSYTHLITKYGVTVRKREDLGRIIKMAFYIASTGKPGPVLIDIPKDIQTAPGPAEYPSSVQIRGYKPNESVHVGPVSYTHLDVYKRQDLTFNEISLCH